MATPSISIPKKHVSTRWIGKLIRQLLFYVLLLVIWQLLASAHIWKDYLFAGPLTVLESTKALYQDGSLVTAILVSVRRLALGYGISLILGLILGLAIGSNHYIEETLGSLVVALQALPSVCWIPLAMLWFGLSEQAMLFVVVMARSSQLPWV
ncbi:hypothetical protein KDW_00030 [Dictyobacter vulcani]|uniref:ABC transmembrane type-1 domain-containing protein n=1 Tax=Dictyobacter vulcani TaxID=2607529 RepID=A0A5J4KI66_9CHLR|nr:hypothetical protein [Dictyobacter vulcani]GER85841.1 hypothetical protein KDW_00030 [Dictyobacter vulcani]